MLKISNLHVTVEGKQILKGFSLKVKPGEIHALMGPNGSGKSTLALSLMGHPGYQIQNLILENSKSEGKKVQSSVELDGVDILDKAPNERAKMGFFLAFQSPLAVAGVPIASFLRTARKAVKGNGEKLSSGEFNKLLIEKAKKLGLDKTFLKRSLNDGFSGGEKKKAEMLQALILEPKYAIFDEIDTGLDIDALKIVAKGIKELAEQGTGILLITHYQRILHHLKPDYVHVIIGGKIVESGDFKLAEKIEKEGYQSILSRSRVTVSGRS